MTEQPRPPASGDRRHPATSPLACGNRLLSSFLSLCTREQKEPGKGGSGFSLIELLVVIAIIAILTALAVPAFNSIKNTNSVTKAAYDIAGTLENARAYAMANNTYTWVGFYEEDAGTITPTSATPPYPGKGRVIVATVYSKDGTIIYGENDAAATLPPDRLNPLNRLLKIENIHMTDLGTPVGGDYTRIDGRPAAPYEYEKPLNQDKFNRFNSESDVYAQFPFTIQGYTFRKTVMFNPRGEARVVKKFGKYDMRPVVEIGLVPTRGTFVDTQNPDVAAIQFTGVAGNAKIYRR